MRKIISPLIVFLILFMALAISINPTGGASAAGSKPAPLRSTANELLDAVNALRVSQGLPAYQRNDILMSTAQGQAEYILQIGVFTHAGPGGTRPFERAIAAGYLVAGDLTRGGYFAENVCGGTLQTATDAVQVWMQDFPHQNTMLSSIFKDAGTGVAVNGNTYYYALDVGLSTGSPAAPASNPTATQAAPKVTATPSSTPNLEDMIVYTVAAGDTLTSISKAYGVPLETLLTLNSLTLNSILYIGDKIIIGPKATATPTEAPSGTPTLQPTETLLPSQTSTVVLAQATSEPIIPTPTSKPAGGLMAPTAFGGISLIIGLFLAAFGVIAMVRTRKKA